MKHRALLLAVTAGGLTAFLAGLFTSPRIIWNPSESAPVGFYWLSDQPPSKGDLALIHPPKDAARPAADRGYLPFGAPLIKPIGAGPGDSVCSRENQLFLNDRIVAERLQHDTAGLPLPW